MVSHFFPRRPLILSHTCHTVLVIFSSLSSSSSKFCMQSNSPASCYFPSQVQILLLSTLILFPVHTHTHSYCDDCTPLSASHNIVIVANVWLQDPRHSVSHLWLLDTDRKSYILCYCLQRREVTQGSVT